MARTSSSFKSLRGDPRSSAEARDDGRRGHTQGEPLHPPAPASSVAPAMTSTPSCRSSRTTRLSQGNGSCGQKARACGLVEPGTDGRVRAKRQNQADKEPDGRAGRGKIGGTGLAGRSGVTAPPHALNAPALPASPHSSRPALPCDAARAWTSRPWRAAGAACRPCARWQSPTTCSATPCTHRWRRGCP
jgi:hypothetical protein